MAAWLEPLTAAEQETLADLAARLLGGRHGGPAHRPAHVPAVRRGRLRAPDRCPVTQAADRAEREGR
jgi:hypothetical protein